MEGELNEKGTVAKFATVQLEGNRKIEREISNASLVRRLPSDSASAKADRYNRLWQPLDWRNIRRGGRGKHSASFHKVDRKQLIEWAQLAGVVRLGGREKQPYFNPIIFSKESLIWRTGSMTKRSLSLFCTRRYSLPMLMILLSNKVNVSVS